MKHQVFFCIIFMSNFCYSMQSDVVALKERANGREVANMLSAYIDHIYLDRQEPVPVTILAEIEKLQKSSLNYKQKEEMLALFDNMLKAHICFVECHAGSSK